MFKLHIALEPVQARSLATSNMLEHEENLLEHVLERFRVLVYPRSRPRHSRQNEQADFRLLRTAW